MKGVRYVWSSYLGHAHTYQMPVARLGRRKTEEMPLRRLNRFVGLVLLAFLGGLIPENSSLNSRDTIDMISLWTEVNMEC